MNKSARVSFVVSFPFPPKPVAEVWQTLLKYLNSVESLPKRLILSEIVGHQTQFYPKKGAPDLVLSPADIESVIKKRNLTGFHIKTNHKESGIGFVLRLYSQFNGSELTTHIGLKAKTQTKWNALIESLMGRWDSVGAWQWLIKYRSWQQALERTESYERKFGIFPSRLLKNLPICQAFLYTC